MFQVDRRSGMEEAITAIEDASQALPVGCGPARPDSFRQTASAAAAEETRPVAGLDLAALLGWAYLVFFVGAVAFRVLRT